MNIVCRARSRRGSIPYFPFFGEQSVVTQTVRHTPAAIYVCLFMVVYILLYIITGECGWGLGNNIGVSRSREEYWIWMSVVANNRTSSRR